LYNGKSVVAIIPARGGSKGIPWKNLCKINGKTLVARAIECAKAVPIIDTVICSTDRERIGVEAYAAGARLIKRPKVLAEDDVGDAEVLRHADNAHDIIVMLQPTCPQRKPEHVTECITKLVDEELDSVWTVSPVPLKYHKDKQLHVGMSIFCGDESRVLGGVTNIRRSISDIRRQDLTQTYFRNGACYAMTRECLREHGTMGVKWGLLVLDGEFISIDTPEDLANAQDGFHDT
jgi:CMP-N,N'-diacetyllegionaminic acid synthase